MNYLEIKFSFNEALVNGDILLAELSQIPFETFIENKGETLAYILKNLWNKDELKKLGYLQENKVQVSVKEIEQVNWNEEWEKNFDPIEISEECIVRAGFHHLSKKYKCDIQINPKMSFGTGHHETTSLVLSEMLKFNFENSKVLDMGTGTGVLAILAMMQGAKNVIAIDNDEWAYKNSVENVALNNFSNSIEVVEGGVECVGNHKFNYVLANINKNIIKAQMDTYVSSMLPNSTLILSGILIEDTIEIIELAGNLGLKKKEERHRNKWAMLVFSN